MDLNTGSVSFLWKPLPMADLSVPATDTGPMIIFFINTMVGYSNLIPKVILPGLKDSVTMSTIFSEV